MSLIVIWLLLSLNQIVEWDILAEEAYLMGNYQEAITYYEMGLENGFSSAEHYFNLGNSYFELGDFGHAMLYYKRASQFSPRDETIQANIERVRALRRDYQQQPTHWGDYITDSTALFLRFDEILWLGSIIWGYACFLLGYGLLKPSFSKQRLFIILNGLLVGVGLLLVGLNVYSTTYRPEAVITTSSAPVLSGASQDYLTLYNLYSGAEIRIVERQGGWARLVLPDGSSGWINRFDFEYVSSQ
jgi:tetratricopeptide (TPR) repeat protein